jgi:hypothetical protein
MLLRGFAPFFRLLVPNLMSEHFFCQPSCACRLSKQTSFRAGYEYLLENLMYNYLAYLQDALQDFFVNFAS